MNKSTTSNQVISLPQGGGALHGIGETFSPDLHTGTGTLPFQSHFRPVATGSSHNSVSATAQATGTDPSVWGGA